MEKALLAKKLAQEPMDRDGDESKGTTSDVIPTGDKLLQKIRGLHLRNDIKKKIEAIASDSAGSSVSLDYDNIGDSGAAALAEGLSTNNTLEILSLRNNNIGDDGAAALGECLIKNNTLRYIYIDQNNIGDDGAVALGEGLSKNNSLQALYLEHNQIGDDGAGALGACLSENDSVLRLYLSFNEIGDDGACALAGGLLRNNALQQLYLNENNFTNAGLLALAKAFRCNENLTGLTANPKGYQYGNLEGVEEIGRGEFGAVRLASLPVIEGYITVVEKVSHGTNNREEIYERLILQGLPEHNNVVKLAAITRKDTLLLEAHKGGSLKNYAKMHQDGTPLQQFLRYSHGMSLAIEHLHKHGVIHRDIAARNYVLTEDLQTAVLVDFGLSWPIAEEKFVRMRPGEKMPFRQCAPEVLSTFQYSKSADVWQLGLAIWQLLHSGAQPFKTLGHAHHVLQFLDDWMERDRKSLPLSFKKIGASQALLGTVREIVIFCCSYDPAGRPTATQVVKRIEFLQETVEVLEEEEKEADKYQPDDKDIEAGLNEYNYNDYGENIYIELENDQCDY